MNDIELGQTLGRIEERTERIPVIEDKVNDIDQRVSSLENQYVSWWFRQPLKVRRAMLGSSGAILITIVIAVCDYLLGRV